MRDVGHEFMQGLLAALHGILGTYLRDALHEGRGDCVACISRISGLVCLIFSSFCLMISAVFNCKN
jgi:uncharacterized YccA/Bax inhibitor family protein